MAIVVFNDEHTHWKDLTVFEEYHQTPTSGLLRESGFDTWLPFNSLVKRMKGTTEILTIDDYAQHKDFPFYDIMAEAGLKEFIHTPLITGDKNIGFLVFDSKRYDTYSKADFPLLKAIADLLAVSVSNILANEEVLEEKNLKETLLGISETLAEVTDFNNLYSAVVSKLKELINFEDAVVIFHSKDYSLHKHSLVVTTEKRKTHPNYHQLVTEWFETENTPVNDIIAGENVAHFQVKDWQKKYPDHSGTQMMVDHELVDTISLALKNGDQVIGHLLFHFAPGKLPKTINYRLYENIAYQMSVTVNNILANQEILKEKKQKEDLLKISTAASNISNRKELLNVILETIKPIFPFDLPGLFIINEQENYHYELLNDLEIFKEDKVVQSIRNDLTRRYDHKGSAVDYLAQGNKPRLFDLQKEGTEWPHPQIPIMTDGGLKHTIGIGLRNGDEMFGMLCCSSSQNIYSEKDFPLFQAISEQVATAVKNIMANEHLL